jgi:hypothetical protein
MLACLPASEGSGRELQSHYHHRKLRHILLLVASPVVRAVHVGNCRRQSAAQQIPGGQMRLVSRSQCHYALAWIFNAMAARTQERMGVDVQLYGVTSSQKMLLDASKLDLASWQSSFESNASGADLSAFSKHFADLDSDAVIFDCTASDAPCDYYEQWLGHGVHVITPNKKLHSGPLERYERVRQLQRDGAAHYFYEV